MPPKSKKQSKSVKAKKGKDKPPFIWTDPLSLILMQVIRTNASEWFWSPNNWSAICEEFKTRTDKTINSKSGKNRVSLLKSKWTTWSKLRFEVTSARWDHEKGCFTAPDEWWDNQKSEKFYTFRYKPSSLEMSDLWDDMFPNMIAAGKNVVAPCMNVE